LGFRTQQMSTSIAVNATEARTPSSAWVSAFILLLLYALSFLDRQIMAMMIEPIRRSLDITDFQVSLLLGLAFSLLYVTCGLFAGSLVDRFARRPLIAAGVALWGLATAACGLASSFLGLFLARMFVGLGESVLTPAAYSFLADAFPRRRLSLALAIFAVGTTAGAGAAMMGGGALIAFVNAQPAVQAPMIGLLQPWQIVFMIVGLVGLPLALLIYLVPEPKRSGAVAKDQIGGWSETLSFLYRRRALWLAIVAIYAPAAMLNYAVTLWTPSVMIREFGWDVAHVGLALGAICAVAGATGQMFFGWLVDRLYARGREDIHFLFFACALVVGVPCAILGYLSGQAFILLGALVVVYGLVMSFAGYAAASIQLTTPGSYRGRVGAVFMLVMNVPGLALGPPLVALLAEHGPFANGRLSVAIAMSFMLLTPIMLAGTLLGRGPLRRALAEEKLRLPSA